MILSPNQIAQMSREEKLQAMEAIWADLSHTDADVASPSWHAAALEETDAKLASGEACVVDWDKAKRDLRKRFE